MASTGTSRWMQVIFGEPNNYITIYLNNLLLMHVSHPSSSFFFFEKKELFGLVVLLCFIFIGLRVFMLLTLGMHAATTVTVVVMCPL